MPPLKIAFRAGRKELLVGKAPHVVGTLTSLARKIPPARLEGSCDLVEVRLDKTGRPPRWLERCQEIQAAGWPVLLTIRLQSEGGAWNGTDGQRLPIFEEALYGLAGVDIEWRSNIVHRVAMLAKRLRKICVISYHDFKKTPPAEKLGAIVLEAQKLASIVKIATQINEPADIAALRLLFTRKWKRPLCVIGMGPEGADTRVSFTKLGSCLTYGYLDKATAPGQFPASELTRQLRELNPEPPKL